jgi:hypothetical protein
MLDLRDIKIPADQIEQYTTLYPNEPNKLRATCAGDAGMINTDQGLAGVHEPSFSQG